MQPRFPARPWPPGTHGARLALAGLLLALAACRPGAAAPDAWVTIRGQRVAVEIARTHAQQQLGLGQRERLAWDEGMLFSYDQPGFYAFWMKDMRFDIDIVWIRGDRIVDLSQRVPHPSGPEGNGPTVRPRELADRVLEVPAGYAESHGWRPGDRVAIEGG